LGGSRSRIDHDGLGWSESVEIGEEGYVVDWERVGHCIVCEDGRSVVDNEKTTPLDGEDVSEGVWNKEIWKACESERSRGMG
jgi:hypothetical protein